MQLHSAKDLITNYTSQSNLIWDYLKLYCFKLFFLDKNNVVLNVFYKLKSGFDRICKLTNHVNFRSTPTWFNLKYSLVQELDR